MPRLSAAIKSLFVRLVIVLSLAAASCGKAPQNVSPGAEKNAARGGAGSPAAAGALGSFLPGEGEASGWKISGETRTFNADNLWEYIDGGAEGYLVYNFKQVLTADYRNQQNNLQAVLDIYKMADRLCGFGIYAAERAYEASYLEIGTQGYVTDNALNFWQGPYYVKITAFEEGSGARLEELAKAVAARLDEPVGNPPELDIFPKEGLLPNSERYLARDVLGQSALKNGFTADYKLGSMEFKLFFILHEDPDSASRSFEVYKEFMSKYGKKVEDHSGEDIPLFSADDPYYGKVVAMQHGKVVMGSLGLEDPEMVNEYLQRMQKKLVDQSLVFSPGRRESRPEALPASLAAVAAPLWTASSVSLVTKPPA